MRYWNRKPHPVPGEPLVTMLVASYLTDDLRREASLRCLLASFEAQTYKNWQAVVVHDGPVTRGTFSEDDPIGDSGRVNLVQTPERLGQFGHPHRHKFASQVESGWVGFTNDDNYYMPVYFEAMLSEALSKGADFVYCDMVHSHQMWKPFRTQPRCSRLDLGGFLARVELVKRTPWTDFSFRGDGVYIDALVANSGKIAKVDATLFVHN